MIEKRNEQLYTIDPAKILAMKYSSGAFLTDGSVANEYPSAADDIDGGLRKAEEQLQQYEKLLNRSQETLEEGQRRIEGLEQQREQNRLHMRCLEAIGPQKLGEDGIAYAARVESSFPGFFEDSMFILDAIAVIPEEGIIVNDALRAVMDERRAQGLEVDDRLFEDGIVTRNDFILLNAQWGNQALDILEKKKATNDGDIAEFVEKLGGDHASKAALEEVHRRYLEELGVDIGDEQVLRGLEFNERSTRYLYREAVQDYMKENTQLREPECEGVAPDRIEEPSPLAPVNP